MKKLLGGLFILCLLFAGSQVVHASTLSDALLKIKNLEKEIAQLKVSLQGAVAIPGTTGPFVPIVASPTVTNITSTSATIGATVTSLGSPAASASSLCIDTAGGTTGCSTNGVAVGPFSRNVSGLTPGTTYYFKGNAISSYGTGWSAAGSFTTLAAPVQPSITVLSPNGGEVYKAVDQITVTWKTNNTSVNEQVMISLESTQSVYGAEIATVPNTGTATITLPTALYSGTIPLISGKYYKIVLQLATGGMGHIAPTDESDNTFTINPTTSPIVKVISPNDGETYTVGDKVVIFLAGGLYMTRVGLVYPDFNPNSPISDGNDVHWMSVVSDGGKSFVWDGSSFIDNNGNKNYWSSGAGNYKIVAIRDVNDTKCYQTKISDCTYDISDNAIKIVSTKSPVDSNVLGKISYWWGKYNIHASSNGAWVSDTSSDAGAALEMMSYCKRWFPGTTEIQEGGTESVGVWQAAGNYTAQSSTKPVYRCVASSITGSATGDVSVDKSYVYQNDTVAVSGTVRNTGSSTQTYKGVLSLLNESLTNTDSTANVYEKEFTLATGGSIGISSQFTAMSAGYNFAKISVYLKTGTTYSLVSQKIERVTVGAAVSTTPSITVLSPNGGETYQIGQQITVKWKSNGVKETNNVIITLENVVSADSGIIIYLTGDKNIPAIFSSNDGIETFNIPTSEYSGIKEGNYKINISASASDTTGVRDESNIFKIKKDITSDGCKNGEIYSSTTGQKCPVSNVPIISGMSGPQLLKTDEVGTWKVTASDSSGGDLSYSVIWGDEAFGSTSSLKSTSAYSQTAALTHSYLRVGTFNPIFTVTNSIGGTATTSLTVNVFDPALDNGCSNGQKYNSITGLLCLQNGCLNGEVYSSTTGALCPVTYGSAPTTRTSDSTTITRTLKVGVKGEDVKRLQTFLGIKADGSFGKGTAAKVKEWQVTNGLKADGAFGIKSALKAGLAQ